MDRMLLKKTPLFEGLTDSQLSDALAFFDARESLYEKGDTVKAIHQPFTRFALVMQGRVHVYMDDLSGEQMMMAHVEKGGQFGESLCYLEKEEPVYAVAASPCRILWLSPEKIRRLQPGTPLEGLLIRRFIASLASRALQMNDRIQILSKKTLEDKLKAFLSIYQNRRGMAFTIPFNKTQLATYLGSNRSALSRVMGQMQKNGLFTCQGRHITLHKPIEN